MEAHITWVRASWDRLILFVYISPCEHVSCEQTDRCGETIFMFDHISVLHAYFICIYFAITNICAS